MKNYYYVCPMKFENLFIEVPVPNQEKVQSYEMYVCKGY